MVDSLPLNQDICLDLNGEISLFFKIWYSW